MNQALDLEVFMQGNISIPILILWPVLGAFGAYLLNRFSNNRRDFSYMFVAMVQLALALFVVIGLGPGNLVSFRLEGFLDLGIELLVDGFRGVYCIVASFMWLLALGFSREYFSDDINRDRYYFFTLLTLAFACGVFLAADVFTTFIFFEMMALTSFAMVIHKEKAESIKAGNYYLFFAILCGMILLFGVLMLQDITGTLRFDELFAICSQMDDKSVLILPGILLLIGFGAKAGMIPLHTWLQDSYSAAPAPANTLLTGILSKTGVFGILAISTNLFYQSGEWGFFILMLGVVTMFLGAVYGLFAVDMKRILACSSISQIGFILLGAGLLGMLGEYNAVAARATFLHMLNHSLIKLALFLAAGAVYMKVNDLSLNTIRGFGRGKPVLHIAFLVGALSIMGIPLTGGYVSKTLLYESLATYMYMLKDLGQPIIFYQVVEWVFKSAGGLTIAYILKIYFALFWEKNELHQQKYDALNEGYLQKGSQIVLCATAIPLLIFGLLPYIVMDPLASLGQAFMHAPSPAASVNYYSLDHLIGASYSIGIGIVVYGLIVRKAMMWRLKAYTNYWPSWLNFDRIIYRPLCVALLATGGFIARVMNFIAEKGVSGLYAGLLAAGALIANILYFLAERGIVGVYSGLLTFGSFVANTLYLLAEKNFVGLLNQRNRIIKSMFSIVGGNIEYDDSKTEEREYRQDVFSFESISEKHKEEKELWQGIRSSLSFSLMLFGLGFIVAVIFLLGPWWIGD